jgi:hypothetical protein
MTNIAFPLAGRSRWIIPSALALLAALIVQVTHEATHALAMLLIGSGVDKMQFFAVLGNPVLDESAQAIISGSAAILNVLLGLVALVAFHQPSFHNKPLARLFLMYLAAYMFMLGFGYFFIDALFYAPDAPFFPDWQYIIHLLGGGWEVRLPLLLVGTVGLLGVFFWLPNAALRFVSQPQEKATRTREILPLTLVPYVAVNVVFSLASFTHPLGGVGVVLTLMQVWMGYIALFWAYFIGGLWTEVKQAYHDPTLLALPARPLWLIGLASLWGMIAFLMLLGLDF